MSTQNVHTKTHLHKIYCQYLRFVGPQNLEALNTRNQTGHGSDEVQCLPRLLWHEPLVLNASCDRKGMSVRSCLAWIHYLAGPAAHSTWVVEHTLENTLIITSSLTAHVHIAQHGVQYVASAMHELVEAVLCRGLGWRGGGGG